MGVMTDASVELFAEFHDAVLAEIERIGPTGLERNKLIRRFLNRGVSRRTLYRWCADILASPTSLRQLETSVTAAAADHADGSDLAKQGHNQVRAMLLPAPPDFVAAATANRGNRRLSFIGLIERCVEDAEDVLEYARTPEGDIRNARLVLAASRHLLQTVETAARVQSSLYDTEKMHRFNDQVIEAIMQESPECARKLLRRLEQLTDAWLPTDRAGPRSLA